MLRSAVETPICQREPISGVYGGGGGEEVKYVFWGEPKSPLGYEMGCSFSAWSRDRQEQANFSYAILNFATRAAAHSFKVAWDGKPFLAGRGFGEKQAQEATKEKTTPPQKKLLTQKNS